MNPTATLFSLARNEPVSLADVRAIITDPQTEEDFYHNYINMFPVVLGSMSAAEIAGQRALTNYTIQNNGAEQYNLTHMLRERNKDIMLAEHNGSLANYYMCPLPSRIEAPFDTAPLLPTWKQWGQQLYGDREFEIQMAEATRRNADSSGPVVGRPVHQDAKLAGAYHARTLSIISACGDESLAPFTDDPFWTTEVFDTCRIAYLVYRERCKLFMTDVNQAYFLQNCEAMNLPANCHILMASDKLHRVGGWNPPAAYRAAFPVESPQPKAYISHAKLQLKPKDLRHA